MVLRSRSTHIRCKTTQTVFLCEFYQLKMFPVTGHRKLQTSSSLFLSLFSELCGPECNSADVPPVTHTDGRGHTEVSLSIFLSDQRIITKYAHILFVISTHCFHSCPLYYFFSLSQTLTHTCLKIQRSSVLSAVSKQSVLVTQ